MNTGKPPKRKKPKNLKQAPKKVEDEPKPIVISQQEARSYSTSKKRIALIVAGQSRSPEMCWASQCNAFDFEGYEIDYFVHSWTVQDLYSVPSGKEDQNTPEGGGKFCKRINHLQNHKKELESKLIDVYNPVGMKVEDYKSKNIVNALSRIYEASKDSDCNHGQINVFKHIGYEFLNSHEKMGDLLRHTCFGQIYSIEQACKLKHDFEEKHGFKYDIAVKIRQDLFFPPVRLQSHRLKDLESGVVMCDWFIEHDIDTKIGGFMGDIIFASNSETMDSLCLGITEHLTNSYIGIAEGTSEAETFIHPDGVVCIENNWPENILYNKARKENITGKGFHFPFLLYRDYMKKLPQDFDELTKIKEHFEKYGHLFTQQAEK